MAAAALTAAPTTTTDEAAIITKMSSYPQFDIVTDYSDHRYENLKVLVSPKVNKRIMKEWRILQNNLPSSIFVRVYENRVNLLRAAIQGAAGTPYHNGLFFFDLSFPAYYPSGPPSVHYHSFGYRINPNLHNNGVVCLSLLNTWSGETCELWNPRESTVLQILLSLQALVLNEDPYYNEPMFSTKKGTQLFEAKWYKEQVYVVTLKTMRCVLSRPLKNFEGIIEEHFRARGDEIISRCKEFAKVCVITHLNKNFYKVRDDLFSELKSVKALPERLEMKVGRKKVVKRKSTGGFVKMVFGKLKKVFGLN